MYEGTRKELQEWVESVAEEIREDEGSADRDDLVWEAVDGSEWVIYYGKAIALVGTADDSEVDDAWDEVRDVFGSAGESGDTYWTLQTRLAFFILRARLASALAEGD